MQIKNYSENWLNLLPSRCSFYYKIITEDIEYILYNAYYTVIKKV